MPDLTISNTSPLFYLHRLNHRDLLRQLYQRIIVPEAVVAELQAGRAQGKETNSLFFNSRFITIVESIKKRRQWSSHGSFPLHRSVLG